MGKTNQLGVLADVFTSDASNNVGIGGSPSGSYKLEVTGTAKVSSNITATQFIGNSQVILNTSGITTGSVYQRMSNSGQTSYFGIDSSAGGDIITGSTAYATVIGTGQNRSFQIGTNDAIRLTITGAGNVGIGTSSPTVLLSVGASQASPVSTADVTLGLNRFIMWGTSGSAAGTVRSWGIANNELAAGDFCIKSSSTNNNTLDSVKLQIKSNGSVSIIGPSATNPTNLSLTCITSTGNNDTLRVSTSFENSGKVSIEILSGSGNRAVYSDSTGLLTNSSSDVTLKTNVENITYGLNSVISLRPVFYNWIPENLGPQKEIGFIAQEVQAIIPEVIGINNDETLSLDYPKLTAVLVKAMQEQNQTITSLQDRLTKGGL